MELLNESEYPVPFLLKFSLSENSILSVKQRWRQLKERCENGNNEKISNIWISFCNPEINKSLSFINSLTGGLRNIDKKSCHYRYSFHDGNCDDNDIIIRYFTNIETCKWTYDELDDLIFAFEKMANQFVGGESVTGTIVVSDVIP